MKVLHVIPSVGPVRGGPSEAVLAMTRALRRQGIEADIVATNDNGPGLLDVKTGSFIDYQGTRICFLPRWSPPVGALREFQYSRGFTDWLRSHLPHYDCVHVHAVFSFLSTRAMQMSRFEGKPFIVRPLGQLDAWSLGQKALKKRVYFNLCENANLRRATAVHCTSEAERANVLALLPKARAEVIPHGVEVPQTIANAPVRLREQLGISPDEKIFLFLSRWHSKKNIPLLLESLAEMKNERWHLVLAGTATDGYEEVVKAAIERLGLASRITCPGHVQGEAKTLLLQGADVFVLPSESENFGIAVAEALCSGLRAIVSHNVDLAPTVEKLDGGTVCEATRESLLSSLRQELHLESDRDGLSCSAQLLFSWDIAAQRLENLYKEICN